MRDSRAAFARTRSRSLPGVALALALASSAAAADAPKLEVVGLEGRTQSLGAADLLALQPRKVSVTDPHGKQPTGVGKTDALVAFERDGQPLPDDVGPFRLVVPSDARGGRWVRGLIELHVLD